MRWLFLLWLDHFDKSCQIVTAPPIFAKFPVSWVYDSTFLCACSSTIKMHFYWNGGVIYFRTSSSLQVCLCVCVCCVLCLCVGSVVPPLYTNLFLNLTRHPPPIYQFLMVRSQARTFRKRSQDQDLFIFPTFSFISELYTFMPLLYNNLSPTHMFYAYVSAS